MRSVMIVWVIRSRRMEWAGGGGVALVGEKRNTYMGLFGKPQGKIPLRRLRRRWNTIKIDLEEISLEGVDWIDVAQDR
jgi:hypothetical protein